MKKHKRGREADRQIANVLVLCLQNFGIIIFESVCGPTAFSGVFVHRIQKIRLFPGVLNNRT